MSYAGQYVLACGGVALLRCWRDNETVEVRMHRLVPENEGVVVGDRFLVTRFEHAGRERWDFSNVIRYGALEATA